MNATTPDGVTVAQAAKEMAANVRTKAAIKLQYLRTLAGKIIADTAASRSKIVSYFKGAFGFIWNAIPHTVRGTILSSMMATREGYLALVHLIKTAVGFVTKGLAKVNHFVDRAIFKAGTMFAKLVGIFSKKASEKVTTWNIKFSGVRAKVTNFLTISTTIISTKLTQAFTGTKAVNFTTTGASVFTGLVAANALTKGAVSSAIKLIPFVGKIVAAGMSGLGVLASLLAIATAGAVIGAVSYFKFNFPWNRKSEDAEVIDLSDIAINDSVETVETFLASEEESLAAIVNQYRPTNINKGKKRK